MIKRTLLAFSALALATSPALAQPAPAIEEELEAEANAEETAAVVAALEAVGCDLGASGTVEKETSGIFEVDDAACAFGQYDIKLDSAYAISSITFDGPEDAAAEGVVADEAVGEEIEDFLDGVGCRVEEDQVEEEAENLYEIDDAECSFGQFDIKIARQDTQLVITSMTRD